MGVRVRSMDQVQAVTIPWKLCQGKTELLVMTPPAPAPLRQVLA